MRLFLKRLFFIVVLLSFLSPPIAYSQSFEAEAGSQLGAFAGERGANYGTPRDPRTVAAYIIKVSLGLLGIAFLGYMVYAGYLILMARGEEDQVTKGKETLKTAVIGMVLILSAYSITLLVAKIATDRKSEVEEIFNDDRDGGLRIRPNPDDFMPQDPLR